MAEWTLLQQPRLSLQLRSGRHNTRWNGDVAKVSESGTSTLRSQQVGRRRLKAVRALAPRVAQLYSELVNDPGFIDVHRESLCSDSIAGLLVLRPYILLPTSQSEGFAICLRAAKSHAQDHVADGTQPSHHESLLTLDLVRCCFRLRCAKTEACRPRISLDTLLRLCASDAGVHPPPRPQALPDEPVTASVCCFGRRRDVRSVAIHPEADGSDDIASPTAGSVEHEACATVAAIMSCLLSLLQPAAASKARSQLWSNVCALGTQLEEAEADGTARSTALFHALRRAGAVRALIDVISLIAPRCTRNLCSESGRDAPSSFRQSIDLGYDGVIGRQELEEDSLHLQDLSEDIDDDHAHEEHCQTGTAPTLLQQQYGNKAAPIASEEKRAECVRCGCITPTAPHVEHYWASLEALATHIVGGLTHRCAWAADDVCQCTVSAFGAMHHAATPLLRSLQTWKGCPGVLEAAMIGGGMRVALEELNRARVEEEPTQSPAVPPSLASRSMMPTTVHAAELSNTATSASRVELSASAHGESADGAVGLQCDRCQLRPIVPKLRLPPSAMLGTCDSRHMAQTSLLSTTWGEAEGIPSTPQLQPISASSAAGSVTLTASGEEAEEEDGIGRGRSAASKHASYTRDVIRCAALQLIGSAMACPGLRECLPSPAEAVLRELLDAELAWPTRPLLQQCPDSDERTTDRLNMALLPDGWMATGYRVLTQLSADEGTVRSEGADTVLRRLSSQILSTTAEDLSKDVNGDGRSIHRVRELSARLRVAAAYVRCTSCWKSPVHSKEQLRSTLVASVTHVRRLLIGSAAIAPRYPPGTSGTPAAADIAEQLGLCASLLSCADELINAAGRLRPTPVAAELRAAWSAAWLSPLALQWSRSFAEKVFSDQGELRCKLACSLGSDEAAWRAIARWRGDAGMHLSLCSALLSPTSTLCRHVPSVAIEYGSPRAGVTEPAVDVASEMRAALALGVDGLLGRLRTVGDGDGWTITAELALVRHLSRCLEGGLLISALPAAQASTLAGACFHRFLALYDAGEQSLRELDHARSRSLADAVLSNGASLRHFRGDAIREDGPAFNLAVHEIYEAPGVSSMGMERDGAVGSCARNGVWMRLQFDRLLTLCRAHVRLLLVLCHHRAAHPSVAATFTNLSVASTIASELSLELQVEPAVHTSTPSCATSARQHADAPQAAADDSADDSSCHSSPAASPRCDVDVTPAVAYFSTGAGAGADTSAPSAPAPSRPAIPRLQLSLSQPSLGQQAAISPSQLSTAGRVPALSTPLSTHGKDILLEAEIPPLTSFGTAGTGCVAPPSSRRTRFTIDASCSATAAPGTNGSAPATRESWQHVEAPADRPPNAAAPMSHADRLATGSFAVSSMATAHACADGLAGNALHVCSTPKINRASSVPSLQLSRTTTPALSAGRAGCSKPPSSRTSVPLDATASTRPSGRHAHLSHAPEYSMASYQSERLRRLLYASASLHTSVLQLMLSLLITPSMDRLESSLVEQVPNPTASPRAALPIAATLHAHLAHPANAHIIAPLMDMVRPMGDAHVTLLRLLAPALFAADRYKLHETIARGAYGSVCACTPALPIDGTPPLAVKTIEVRRSRYRRSNLGDVFSEVTSLTRLRGENHVVELFEFGTDGMAYWLVMRRYPCTLDQWAKGSDSGSPSTFSATEGLQRRPLTQLLDAYEQVISAVSTLHRHRIAHFDLKAANLLCVGESRAAFRLTLADFGEAKVMGNKNMTDTTPRGRGTECIKSPEMLLVPSQRGSDQRLPAGALGDGQDADIGQMSDIWSLGCLLYEILVGEQLFSGEDCSAFFIRVTTDSMPLLSPEKVAQLPPEHAERVTAFLLAVLQRRAESRPSITEIKELFAELKASIEPSPSPPRGSLGKVELDPSLQDGHSVKVEGNDSSAQLRVETRASCPWAPFPPSAVIRKLSGRYLAGIVAIGPNMLIAPRRALGAEGLLHSLDVGAIVLCGVELPARIHDPQMTALSFDVPFVDLAATTATARQLVNRIAVCQQNTVLVGDDARSLASALLQAREGLTEFEAWLRIREAYPINRMSRELYDMRALPPSGAPSSSHN